jgi:GWxTD domain-containing protein
MRFLNSVFVVGAGVALIWWSADVARAQVEVSRADIQYINEPYYIDALTFADRTSSRVRLDVFAHVGYELLSFVKEGDRHDARYEMTVTVYDTDEALVSEKLWTEEISGLSFDESVSPDAYKLSQKSVILDPGRYTVSVNMRDMETNSSRRLVRPIAVPDYTAGDLGMSDVLLISSITERGERRSIVPNITGNVGNVSGAFYIFFEIYNRLDVDTVLLVTNILDKKNETVSVQDTLMVLEAGRNDALVKINHEKLPLGDYSLVVRAFSPDSTFLAAGEHIGHTIRYFSARWEGMPKGVDDIDLAITQLRYIARDEELRTLDDAETIDEKQDAFMGFWKKRDPNPNTPRNEKMEEYYRRVAYADKEFSHHIEGWRTDMGMVFIIFGPPNDVDRHPFDVNEKPYEIWRYYAINYEFVFLDQTGFGDYRLITPIWEAWKRADTWGRY